MNTISQLKSDGFKVYVKHYRRATKANVEHPLTLLRENKLQDFINPKGGRTVVTLVKGEQTFTGEAVCHPNDSFNKKIALQIALARAVKNSEESVGFLKSTINAVKEAIQEVLA